MCLSGSLITLKKKKNPKTTPNREKELVFLNNEAAQARQPGGEHPGSHQYLSDQRPLTICPGLSTTHQARRPQDIPRCCGNRHEAEAKDERTHASGLGWLVRVGCCGGSGSTPGTTWCCGIYATRRSWLRVAPTLGSGLAGTAGTVQSVPGPTAEPIPASCSVVTAPGQSQRQESLTPPPKGATVRPRRGVGVA